MSRIKIPASEKAIRAEIQKQVEIIKDRAETLISVEELKAKLEKSLKTGQPLKVKLGVDPSAPDLHLGHVVVMKKLREFQELGHEIYFIIGDFTGMIGDPSGKSQTRIQLTREEVEANAKTYEEQAKLILDPEKSHTMFNSTWLSPMSFRDVIDLGAKFTVARMLERDDFSTRYKEGSPIGIHEFLYPLAQAYDSVAIKADVEMGGTDQTFNLLVGRSIQKEFGQESQIALTMPLLIGLDGKEKMSKSLGNYIAPKDEPNDMYGKVMSLPDPAMPAYYRLVLVESDSWVKELVNKLKTGKIHPKKVKMDLARRIVAEFHGEIAAEAAENNFEKIFSQRDLPDDIAEVCPDNMGENDEVSVARLLNMLGLAPSTSEARRHLKAGAVKIDGVKIVDQSACCRVFDGMIIQIGKRKIARIRLKSS